MSMYKDARDAAIDPITLTSSGDPYMNVGGMKMFKCHDCKSCGCMSPYPYCKDCQMKMMQSEKDEYVSKLYHFKERLQCIMDRIDDEHDIQAHYQLGALRYELEYFIKSFEDEALPDDNGGDMNIPY